MQETDLDEIHQVRRMAGGWLAEIVHTVSAITGGHRWHRVTWRNGEPSCCPNQRMAEWGDETAPVLSFDPRNDGGIQPAHRQCGGCGMLTVAPVRITALVAGDELNRRALIATDGR